MNLFFFVNIANKNNAKFVSIQKENCFYFTMNYPRNLLNLSNYYFTHSRIASSPCPLQF